MHTNQSTHSVLMVRPTSFGFDSETARTNTFQHHPQLTDAQILAYANTEFENAVKKLKTHGINVLVINDEPLPQKPNAVFPNNWLSMWPDGHIFLYPMATKSRRIERTKLALTTLQKNFSVTKITDISGVENESRYLESTGVMIFHHPSKIVYGCLSVRCDRRLFEAHAAQLGYTPILFHAVNEAGVPIYHTNVMMAIQSSTAVVCFDAIHNANERALLKRSLTQSGLKIVAINYAQMNAFCGNVLELTNKSNEHFLALSQTAFDHFTSSQRKLLSADKILLPLSIPTIEIVGGGSVRCMLAEIFLPYL